MRLQLLVLTLLLALVTGCATTGGSNRPSPLRGYVTFLPSEGPVALDESGRIRTLVGPRQLLAQLERIPGAYISVNGSTTADAVRVRTFEIIDAGDGLRPLVGWLIVDQAGVQLEDSVTGTRLALRGGALRKLKDEHGARIWVTGTVVGPQILLVAHWGVLIPR